MNCLLPAVFALALPAISPAQIEFTAYLQSGGTDYFMLTDLDAGAKSDWLPLGRAFRGRQLVEYDAARSALVVTAGEKRETLLLRDATTRAGDATGPRVVASEFGWFAPKQRQKGRGTAEVPLELGVTFGIEATLAGLPPKTGVQLELRLHTPPLPQPDGTLTTMKTTRPNMYSQPDGRLPIRLHHSFEQSAQLVPGIYRAVLVHEGRVLGSGAQPRLRPYCMNFG
jgi:hypothetical protein